jgi:flagellar biogenesis protein FliO
MTDVSFADLVLRMLLSLAIVLAIVLGAYAVIRKRQGLGGSSGGIRRVSLLPRRARSTSKGGVLGPSFFGGRSSKMPGSRRGLRVVGRVGIGRTTQVVAVQFAEKVFLLGASEQSAPTILAELEMSAWLEATETPDDSGGAGLGTMRDRGSVRAASGGQPTGGDPGSTGSTGLLQALRDATVRRG